MPSNKRTLLVGQSGGPTAVVNSTAYGILNEAKNEGYRVLATTYGIRGLIQDLGMYNLTGWDSENLLHTPGAAFRTSRYTPEKGDIDKVLDRCARLGITDMIYCGGDGSAAFLNKLSEAAKERGAELRIRQSPKTVDNDLVSVHFSPGYPSGAKTLAVIAREVATDARSSYPRNEVILIESIGRDAGWVAGSVSILLEYGFNPLIYVPERPVTKSKVVDDVREYLSRDGYALVVMAEGLKDAGTGKNFVRYDTMSSNGQRQLGGVADIFEDAFVCNGIKVRKIIPGTEVRSDAQNITPVDRAAAIASGRYAVRSLREDAQDSMVTISLSGNRLPPDGLSVEIDGKGHLTFGLMPLGEISGRQRMVPGSWINAESNGVTDEFRCYVRPLMGRFDEFAVLPVDRRI